jgi:CheY-like chemotaxis protein/HPt (histidine-containing phosphotransfer) domain-containing protein
MMPRMDGLEVVRRIHGHPLLGRETLLLLSSLDDPEILGQARALAVHYYLRKPITRPELERTLLAALARPQPAESEPLQPTHPAPTGPGMRVLLAEDNPTNQLVAVKMLERAGHAVSVAVNGVEVLEKLRQQEFDLVLMDVQMPEMSGLEAARRIRAQEQTTGAHLPIVGLTAGAMREDRDACLASGMDDFLPKPVRRQTLLATLAKVRGRPAAREAGPPRQSEPAAAAEIPTIDRAKLRDLQKLQGNDASFLGEIIELFAADGERRVVAMRRALAARHGPDLRREAHTLKGSGRELGAARLVEVCQQVEKRGKAAAFDGVEELLARVEEEFVRTRDELREYLEREESGLSGNLT